MKVVTKNKETRIYPFLSPKEKPTALMGCITIYANGLIQLDEFNKMTMSADIAQALAEALLHAVEVAKKDITTIELNKD